MKDINRIKVVLVEKCIYYIPNTLNSITSLFHWDAILNNE